MIGALLRGSRWQRPLWLVALGVGLAAYFGYHALTGSRGLLAWRDLNAELASTRQELDALRAERTALAEKVARLRHDGLERLARPLLATLVDEAGETGHLGVLDGRETLYLIEHRSPVGDVLVTDVGVRLPAHLTASGRALLSWLPRQQLTALYPTSASLSRRTERGPTSLTALRRLLAADRDRGFAEDAAVLRAVLDVATP